MKVLLIVSIGSRNPVKVKAVRNAFANYFKEIEVKEFRVESKVREQPLNLEEIVKGARNRAKKVFEESRSDFAVGIESGIIEFPSAESGYMELTLAVIFDGRKYYFGAAPLFEYPKKVIELVLKEKEDITSAFRKSFGTHKELGKKEGAIGVLSKGVIEREKFTEMAVVMALTGIVSKKFFE